MAGAPSCENVPLEQLRNHLVLSVLSVLVSFNQFDEFHFYCSLVLGNYFMMIVCKGNCFYCFMKQLGNKPPGVLPAKAAYMFKDIERLRDFYGIPLVPPSVSIKSVIFGLSVMQTQTHKQRPTNTGMLVRGRVILILFGFLSL